MARSDSRTSTSQSTERRQHPGRSWPGGRYPTATTNGVAQVTRYPAGAHEVATDTATRAEETREEDAKMIRDGELMGIVTEDGVGCIHVKDSADGSFLSVRVDDPDWLSRVMSKLANGDFDEASDGD